MKESKERQKRFQSVGAKLEQERQKEYDLTLKQRKQEQLKSIKDLRNQNSRASESIGLRTESSQRSRNRSDNIINQINNNYHDHNLNNNPPQNYQQMHNKNNPSFNGNNIPTQPPNYSDIHNIPKMVDNRPTQQYYPNNVQPQQNQYGRMQMMPETDQSYMHIGSNQHYPNPN